jgi:hypothetical protein
MKALHFKSAVLTFLLVIICLFTKAVPGVTKAFYGEVSGQKVYQYTLVNKKGMTVKIITYGASITDIITADKNVRWVMLCLVLIL